MKVTAKIRGKNRKLEEMIVELRMAILDLIDNFRDLRISNYEGTSRATVSLVLS